MSRGYQLADDETLLRVWEEVGKIKGPGGVAERLGFADPWWVSRRLRRLGVPPQPPGPKRPNREEVA